MPSFTFECETRTPEQVQQFRFYLEGLRRDRNLTRLQCFDDNPLTPFVTRVEVTYNDLGLDPRSRQLLQALGAVAVPAVPTDPSLYETVSQAQLGEQLSRRGYLSLWASRPVVSQLDIRDVRPQGAPLAPADPGTTVRQAFEATRDLGLQVGVDLAHDDQVDALALALYSVDRVPGASLVATPFTRRQIIGFSRIQGAEAFRQEYEGTFRAEDPEEQPITLDSLRETMAQIQAVPQGQRPILSPMQTAIEQIQLDEDRRILALLDDPIPVPPVLQRPKAKNPEPKPTVPEKLPRTRFERINDEE